MLKCVLWGASGHAKVLASLIDQMGGTVDATLDVNPEVPQILGVKSHRGSDALLQWLSFTQMPEDYTGVICIGGDRGADRLFVVEQFRQAGIQLTPLIHPLAHVDRTACLGVGSHVLAGALLAAEVQVGEGCIINHSVNIDHESTVGDGVHIAPGAVVSGLVRIESCAFVGAGSVILPRLTIGAHATVGAGAVVTRSVAPHTIVVGNPARPLTRGKL